MEFTEHSILQLCPNINISYANVIARCITTKNLNLILDICKKEDGKISVPYFFFNTTQMPFKKGYVYFLIKNDVIVYIGASSRRYRVLQHRKTKDYDYFYYLPCENYNHWHIETLLLQNFQTKYNHFKFKTK